LAHGKAINGQYAATHPDRLAEKRDGVGQIVYLKKNTAELMGQEV